MARDAAGNELKVGDLVLLMLERPTIFGRVTELREGGIVTGMRGGKPEIKPTHMVILSNHTIDVDPNLPLVGSVLALRDPNPPDLGGNIAPVIEAKEEKPN